MLETHVWSARERALPPAHIAAGKEGGKRSLGNTSHAAASTTPSPSRPEPLPPLGVCPALRLRRKTLPEPGVGADHLSEAGLQWLGNGPNRSHVSPPSSARPLCHRRAPCFAMPRSPKGKRHQKCSAAWEGDESRVTESGKTLARGEGGSKDGSHSSHQLAQELRC